MFAADFMQLYIIQLFPACFLLTQYKDENTYKEAINQLKLIAARYDVTFNPRKLLVDYEKAVHTVFIYHFPGIIISGCYFHFSNFPIYNYFKRSWLTKRSPSLWNHFDSDDWSTVRAN